VQKITFTSKNYLLKFGPIIEFLKTSAELKYGITLP
jgi:hypothetical protein